MRRRAAEARRGRTAAGRPAASGRGARPVRRRRRQRRRATPARSNSMKPSARDRARRPIEPPEPAAGQQRPSAPRRPTVPPRGQIADDLRGRRLAPAARAVERRCRAPRARPRRRRGGSGRPSAAQRGRGCLAPRVEEQQRVGNVAPPAARLLLRQVCQPSRSSTGRMNSLSVSASLGWAICASSAQRAAASAAKRGDLAGRQGAIGGRRADAVLEEEAREQPAARSYRQIDRPSRENS